MTSWIWIPVQAASSPSVGDRRPHTVDNVRRWRAARQKSFGRSDTLVCMRQRWPWKWRTTWHTVIETGPAETSSDLLSAEQRGNVTSAHRQLLAELIPQPGATWAAQALWSCLNDLRLGTAAGAEVRVEQAWTDGPDAFCIVYTPPYQPAERVGLRRQIHDTAPAKYEPAVGPGYAALVSPMLADEGPDGGWEPVEFGQVVAAYDIGEPLGNAYYMLRRDDAGVGWWGALQSELPHRPGTDGAARR